VPVVKWGPRRILVLVGAVLMLASLFELAGSTRVQYANDWPVDYNLNLVAARRLVERAPLYDRAEARSEGIRLLGRDMAKTGKTLFSSYIGDPVVALTQVPFLPLGNEQGARLFRLLTLLEMVGAIVLVVWSLSPPARAPAALLALAALFFGFPLMKGLSLGQNNGFVMLALAVGLFGTARQRWGLAGVGLGVATALKISPGLLVLYLLLRGKTRAVGSAVVTAVALTVTAAAFGRPEDMFVWLRDVSPHVSKGSVMVFNQSIVGAAARLTASVPDFWSQAGPGAWYVGAYVLWGLAVFGLYRLRRGRPVDPLELGILILVILVAGPLSWDYYYAWAVLPLVFLLDLDRWRGRGVFECCVLGAMTLLAVLWTRNAIPVPSIAAASDDWWQRVRTIRYLGVGLLYLGVGVWMLAKPGRRQSPAAECDDGGTAAVGAPREVVAGGVHRRG
jgi:hypothetical protein